MTKFSIAIHGGAGTILKEHMSPEIEKSHVDALQSALNAGYEVLEKGGTSLTAVKTAIISLENNILFNAGRGSVFTNKGIHEMDASIMNGKNLEAGAVAGVRNIKNPIELAELVMLNSGHVFLSSEGAMEFAISQGVRPESDEYFHSDFRHDQWKDVCNSDQYQLDHRSEKSKRSTNDKKFGTVGAVACDQFGNLAAGTSTGGMTNKRYGRIGDSPIIGAGTYANNNTCAISCTGHGELFIRAVAAYDISCLMEYKNLTLQQACEEVVLKKLVEIKGEGGLIGMDAQGNASLVFNSAGMYRGMRNSVGENYVAIYEN